MFSPEEQRKIQAKSLQQWQQEQRAQADAAYVAALTDTWPQPLTWNDKRFLAQLHISPA